MVFCGCFVGEFHHQLCPSGGADTVIIPIKLITAIPSSCTHRHRVRGQLFLLSLHHNNQPLLCWHTTNKLYIAKCVIIHPRKWISTISTNPDHTKEAIFFQSSASSLFYSINSCQECTMMFTHTQARRHSMPAHVLYSVLGHMQWRGRLRVISLPQCQLSVQASITIYTVTY